MINIKNKGLTITISLIAPILIVLSLPLGLTSSQAVILAGIILVVTWWAFKIVNTSVSSAALIVFFLLFSKAPAAIVLRFPLSDIFLILIAATLLSEGIIKSNLSTRISVYILSKYGTSGIRLVALPFVIDFILMFFIPQPFPRVILLAAVYSQFLNAKAVDKKTASVLMFGVFTAATGTSMLLLNGDILLNNLALEFAGISMTWLQWAVNMFMPSLIICGIMFLTFLAAFRQEITGLKIDSSDEESLPLSGQEKKAMVILGLVIVFWMTEAIHGLPTALISLGGVVIMFIAGLLEIGDVKKLNLELVIFLTAAFSIGGVMAHSGTAEVVFDYLVQFMPAQSSPLFFPFIIAVVMALHMVIGSTVTTLAVALPGIIMLNNNAVNPGAITLAVYTAANIHYLLPFQHVIIMIGAGKGYYETKHVIKYGLLMTFVVFIVVQLVQLPWWKLIALL